MKKHLIAAGVVAAFAAPAMAQNVSVYGIVDINWQTVDTDTKGSASAMQSNALATSRLGFRGSEDLGGGLKAEFQLEGTMKPMDGQLGTNATSTTNGVTDSMFDRESWVGLSGAFGAVRFGTTDVSDSVNIDAKVSQIGDLGLISEHSTDKNKTVRYTTPKFGNFQAQVGYANPSATTKGIDGTGEQTANSLTNVYGQYEAGPLAVYLGYEIRKIDTSNDSKQYNIGAKYDMGVASFGLVYSSRDNVTSSTTSGGTAASYSVAANGKDLKQYVLSAAVPLQNGFKIHGAYEVADLAGSDAGADFKAYTLALTKALSKRTSLYAAYVNTDKTLSTELDSATYAVGVVHQF